MKLNIYSIKKSRFITKEAIENSATKVCSAPSILIVSRVGVGKVALSNSDICTSQDFTNLVNIKCNEIFLSYLISKRMKQISSNTQGTSIKGITSTEIKSQIIYLPENKIEQTKIASFLSVIDERITTQIKIIEELESLSKGVREKLLTQQLRFKDDKGNGFADWIEIRLGNIGETYNGLVGKTKEDFGIGEKYIQYKQVFDSSKIQIEKCELVDISTGESQNRVQYGDVFFTISSETPEEIGMSSVLLNETGDTYLNSFCFGFRPHSPEVINPHFSRFFFRSEVFRNEIIKLAQGSTRYNISKIELMKLLIRLPHLEEQVSIATFLTFIDEKIETEKGILQKLENQKKFLLQNLFI